MEKCNGGQNRELNMAEKRLDKRNLLKKFTNQQMKTLSRHHNVFRVII